MKKGIVMPNRRQFLTIAPLGALALSSASGWTGRVLAAESDAVTLAYPNDVPNWDPIATASPVAVSIFKCVFDMVFQPVAGTPGFRGECRRLASLARH